MDHLSRRSRGGIYIPDWPTIVKSFSDARAIIIRRPFDRGGIQTPVGKGKFRRCSCCWCACGDCFGVM